jgi:hypothetical protein
MLDFIRESSAGRRRSRRDPDGRNARLAHASAREPRAREAPLALDGVSDTPSAHAILALLEAPKTRSSTTFACRSDNPSQLVDARSRPEHVDRRPRPSPLRSPLDAPAGAARLSRARPRAWSTRIRRMPGRRCEKWARPCHSTCVWSIRRSRPRGRGRSAGACGPHAASEVPLGEVAESGVHEIDEVARVAGVPATSDRRIRVASGGRDPRTLSVPGGASWIHARSLAGVSARSVSAGIRGQGPPQEELEGRSRHPDPDPIRSGGARRAPGDGRPAAVPDRGARLGLEADAPAARGPHLARGLRVPDPHGPVPGRAREATPSGGERERVHVVAVAAQGRARDAVLRLPDADRRVRSSPTRAATVGRESERVDAVGVAESTARGLHVEVSHRRTVESVEPLARSAPSGEKASDSTSPAWPTRRATVAPLARSQTWTILAPPVGGDRRPSGERRRCSGDPPSGWGSRGRRSPRACGGSSRP